MTLAVLAPDPSVAIAAYGVLGLGVATIVPIAFTLAGNAPGVPPAWGISRVTTLGYAGLFSSPPVIGLVAQVDGTHRRAGDPGRPAAARRPAQPRRVR